MQWSPFGTGRRAGHPRRLRVLRPRIARELGDDAARRMFAADPARAFAAEWR